MGQEHKMDDEEKVEVRNGDSQSLYISKKGIEILDQIRKATRRSKSDVVSMVLEKYGPAIIKDPKTLHV